VPAFGYRRGMSLIERADGFQRRHRAVGFPLAVVYKYADDQGGHLAALVTYYGFVSLFPLLLLLSTILGFVLAGDPGLQRAVLDSALRQFPVIGRDLGHPRQIGGGTLGLVVGLLGAVYGGLGVAQALQHAMNTAWSVPRNIRPNPFRGRLLSLGLLGTVGLAVVATSALTAVGSSAAGLVPQFSAVVHGLLIAAVVALNAAIFAAAFRLTTARELSVRDVLPGAVTAAIAWQGLQLLAASYVRHVASATSVTGGVFALVLGLMAFLYLASVLVVLSVEINVVRVQRLYPRALLTPFTDAVDLTPGDKDAYTAQAQAQRAKGFEEVDVTFGPRPEADGDG
jgi:membrane protein